MLSQVAELISSWAGLVALVLTSINIVTGWVSAPGKALETKFTKLADDVECAEDKTLESLKLHDRRIQRLEDGVRYLPTKEDVHNVSVEVARLSEKVGTVGRTVERMDAHLREGGS